MATAILVVAVVLVAATPLAQMVPTVVVVAVVVVVTTREEVQAAVAVQAASGPPQMFGMAVDIQAQHQRVAQAEAEAVRKELTVQQITMVQREVPTVAAAAVVATAHRLQVVPEHQGLLLLLIQVLTLGLSLQTGVLITLLK